MKLDESQKGAIKMALSKSVCVINGGAGTGKTSIISRIVDDIEKSGGSVELCSFAGKAAARIREATHHEASTIHSMLAYMGDAGFARRSLSGCSVIVDESSMVPSELLYEIVKRNPSKLVLVGDEAQLPPVGNGQPFKDIIAKRPDLVATLTTCYRNKEAVFAAAYRVRSGEMPEMDSESAEEKFHIRTQRSESDTHKFVLDAVRNGEVDFSKDIILCCRNGSGDSQPCSVKAMNSDIKAIVNPSESRMAVNDRVICGKNHPELDVWNGTTGYVQAIDEDGSMYVKLDFPAIDVSASVGGNTVYRDSVLIEKKNMKDWSLAYALTTHKSQGSQYRKVFFVCLNHDVSAGLLDRSMVYTAITRARSECVVAGEFTALRRAVGIVPAKRTVLQQLFKV